MQERITRRVYLHVVDVVAIPRSPEEFVSKAKNQNVLHHFLTKVVVNAENLLLLPVGL
jgi:hypothetical protein